MYFIGRFSETAEALLGCKTIITLSVESLNHPQNDSEIMGEMNCLYQL